MGRLIGSSDRAGLCSVSRHLAEQRRRQHTVGYRLRQVVGDSRGTSEATFWCYRLSCKNTFGREKLSKKKVDQLYEVLKRAKFATRDEHPEGSQNLRPRLLLRRRN
jgi:hypothetical protein